MQSGWNDEIRRLAACLWNRPALPIGRSPDSTSKPSTHQTFQQCNRTRSAERRAREHERVTAEERGSPESGSGGEQRRGPVEERPQSTRGGRHGALVGRWPQESKLARQLLDELLRPGGGALLWAGRRGGELGVHPAGRLTGSNGDGKETAQI